MTSGRPDRAVLHGLLIAGYLLAWAGFGVAAHLWTRAARWTRRLGLGRHHAWTPGAIVLIMAGAFQFSRLKYRCLDQVPHSAWLHHEPLARPATMA